MEPQYTISSDSKASNFSQKRLSKNQLVIFAIIFALIGGYFVFRSFAAEAAVTVNHTTVGTGTNQFNYTGLSSGNTSSAGSWGTAHASATNNDMYQVRFWGTQIKVYGAKGADHGIAGISIDGLDPAKPNSGNDPNNNEIRADTYSSSPISSSLLYTSPVLAEGYHLLHVRVTGLKNASSSGIKIVADKVEVISNSPQPSASTPPNFEQLVYEDNFDSGTVVNNKLLPDSSKWSYYGGDPADGSTTSGCWGGHAGNGLRCKAALSVAEGNLIITAQNVDTNGDGVKDKLRSGGIASKTNMAYGKYVARIKTEVDPSGTMSGLALTWPKCRDKVESGQTNCRETWPDDGELDWYETGTKLSRDPLHSFIHWPCNEGSCLDSYQSGYIFNGIDASTAYRTVVMEWTPWSLQVTVDGAVINTWGESREGYTNGSKITNIKHIPDWPHHVTFQLDALKSTPFPDNNQIVRHYVDYVRVYKLNYALSPSPGDTTAPTVNITAPAANSTVSGTSNLSANATDNVGVVGVQFKANGTNIGTEDADAPYSIPWNTTATPNGSYNITAVARDATGNSTTSSAITVNVNNSSSVDPKPKFPINAVLKAEPGDGKAILTWPAAEDDVGIVKYQIWLNEPNTFKAEINNPSSLTYTVPNLTNGQSYSFRVVAYDADNNFVNANFPSVTPNLSDATPPVVTWEAPSAGATVSGQFTEEANNCRVNVSDASGIDRVEFFFDNSTTPINSAPERLAPYNCFPLDTTQYSNGAHSIRAVAYDKDVPTPRSTTSTVNFTIKNGVIDTAPPTATITAPAANATIAGNNYTTTTSVTDDTGISKVEFYLDNTLKLSQNETASPLPVSKTYNYSFDTFQFANNSQHTFMVKVYDGVNAPATSSVSFTVNNPDITKPTAPTSLNLALTNNNTDVKLDWSGATDNLGVTNYLVYRYVSGSDPNTAGAIANLGNVATYTDTTVQPGISYTYYVIAKDAAGNLSSASPTKDIAVPTVIDEQKPSAPTNLVATASATTNQINLTWAASTDNVSVAGYNVYRGLSADLSAITTKVNTNLVMGTSLGDSAGLSADTEYFYLVEAVDAAGNKSLPMAAPASARTPLADTSAPSITITSPVNSTVSGHVTISANASDNRAVTRTEVYVDNKLYASSSSGSLTTNWNTNPKRWEGSHTITIKARDATGNSSDKSMTVTVR